MKKQIKDITDGNGLANDLICPPSKVSEHFYPIGVIAIVGLGERLATVHRLQTLLEIIKRPGRECLKRFRYYYCC